MTLPTTQVLAAFGQDPFLNPAAYTWTDIGTGYLLEYSDDSGRHHESSRFEAGTGTILLDNTDSRFSTWNTSSPYWPNLTIGVPIQVNALYDSVSYPMFWGYADTWTPQWEGSLYQNVLLHITDGLKMLALFELTNTTIYPDTILALNPTCYYPFNDAVGTLAPVDASGNNAPAAVNQVVAFGQTALRLYDTATCLQLGYSSSHGTFGGVIIPQAVANVAAGSSVGWTMEIWVWGITGTNGIQIANNAGSGSPLFIGEAGGTVTYGTGFAGSAITSTTTVNDGNMHHIVVTGSTGTGSQTNKLYVDGVLQGTSTITVGMFINGPLASPTISTNQNTGTENVADFAVYPAVLTGAQVLNNYTIGKYLQLASDSTGTRIQDVLNLAVPGTIGDYSALVTGDTTSVQGDTTTDVGTKALSYIGLIVDTEAGTFYQNPQGAFQFNARDDTINGTSLLLFSDDPANPGVPWEEGKFALAMDDLDTWAITTVEPNASIATTTAEGTTSATIESYTNPALVASVAPRVNDFTGLYYTTLAQAQNAAQWYGTVFGAPLHRIDSMMVALWTGDDTSDTWGSNAAAVLSLLFLQEVTVRRQGLPTADGGGSAFDQTFVIEGISHHVVNGENPEFMVTFRLSPNEPAYDWFVLNDPTYGVLNAGNLLSF
jgi:Concanavalin A-like lectin/glucanases superfamily